MLLSLTAVVCFAALLTLVIAAQALTILTIDHSHPWHQAHVQGNI
jgi:hypothetical protein